MRAPRLLTALVVVALAAAGAACGSDDDSSDAAATSSTTTTTAAPETTTTTAATTTTAGTVTIAGQTVTTARLLSVANGLCEAAAQAPTDFEAAKKTFNGRAHDGLHLIARGLEEVDRELAATLLQAKQKVEADLARKAAGTQVAADLKPLHEVTVSALARFNVTASPCPPA